MRQSINCKCWNSFPVSLIVCWVTGRNPGALHTPYHLSHVKCPTMCPSSHIKSIYHHTSPIALYSYHILHVLRVTIAVASCLALHSGPMLVLSAMVPCSLILYEFVWCKGQESTPFIYPYVYSVHVILMLIIVVFSCFCRLATKGVLFCEWHSMRG